MKLYYDLPDRDEACLSEVLQPGEKRMYCLPYDYDGDR